MTFLGRSRAIGSEIAYERAVIGAHTVIIRNATKESERIILSASALASECAIYPPARNTAKKEMSAVSISEVK